MKSLFRSLLLVFLYFSVSACGNKGDLYMPDNDKDKDQSTIVNPTDKQQSKE